MRRLLSILLLLGLILGPALEAIPAQALAWSHGSAQRSALRSGWTGKLDESTIPLCCRRNGKHHCTMAVPAGETVLTSSECCPCFPHSIAAAATNSGSAIAEQAFLPAPAIEESALRAIELAGKASTLDRIQTQRGPPISLLN